MLTTLCSTCGSFVDLGIMEYKLFRKNCARWFLAIYRWLFQFFRVM